MKNDHREFLMHECETMKLGIDQVYRERDKLAAENVQLQHDLAETRERLCIQQRAATRAVVRGE